MEMLGRSVGIDAYASLVPAVHALTAGACMKMHPQDMHGFVKASCRLVYDWAGVFTYACIHARVYTCLYSGVLLAC